MVFSINPTAAKTQAQFQQMAIAQNGTGAATPITGGSSSAAPAPPPAQSAPPAAAPPAAAPPAQSAPPAAAPPAGGDNSIQPGKGTVGADGSCSCFVQCAPGSFPVNAAQGVGSTGGWGGALPMNMAAMS